jgi:hypothetical protein
VALSVCSSEQGLARGAAAVLGLHGLFSLAFRAAELSPAGTFREWKRKRTGEEKLFDRQRVKRAWAVIWVAKNKEMYASLISRAQERDSKNHACAGRLAELLEWAP